MEDRNYIFGSIFFIAQRWQDIADREVYPKIGITIKQWMLIVVLIKVFDNHLPTISGAAEALGTSRQNLKRIALELQKKGFLTIIKDAGDQRIQRLHLTGKHTLIFDGRENEKWQEDFVSRLFKGVNVENMGIFKVCIEQLMNNIEELKK